MTLKMCFINVTTHANQYGVYVWMVCPRMIFSTLYTTLPHNLIKEKLLDLIEWTFKRALKNYGSLYLACNDRKAFFTSSDQSRYTLWSCQNVCDALSYLLDNIYIRFGTKLYRQLALQSLIK